MAKWSDADKALIRRMAAAMQVWHLGRPMNPQEQIGDNYRKFASIALNEMRRDLRNPEKQ